MKRVIIPALVALLALSACGKQPEKQEETAKEISVTTQICEVGSFSTYSTYTGNIKPKAKIAVTPKMGGKVVRDNAEVGKAVSAGDVLFELESTDQRLQVEQAQAAYNSAVAGYERTIGGSAQQSVTQAEQAYAAAETELGDARANLNRAQEAFDSRIAINQAKNAVDQAQIAYDNAVDMFNSNASVTAAQTNYDTAKLAYERTKELFATGAVSQQAMENAEGAYKSAEAQLHSAQVGAQQNVDSAKIALDNAQQQYKNAEINLTTSLEAAKTRYSNAETNYNSAAENLNLTKNVINPENAKSAKAQVASAQAALNIAKQSLENTVVRSPINGVISAENINEGEIASAQASAVTVVDLNGVTIEIDISENAVSYVNAGTPAEISVASAGIDNISGTVAAVSPVAAQNGMFNAKIYVDNTSGVFKGGMIAEVKLASQTAENAVMIPAEALTKNDMEAYVYVNNGGKPEKVTVTTGIADDNTVQITSGLSGGEEVIVKGKDYITDNCTLKISN